MPRLLRKGGAGQPEKLGSTAMGDGTAMFFLARPGRALLTDTPQNLLRHIKLFRGENMRAVKNI